MVECTVCNTAIEANHCPNCGQKYISEKLTLMTILSDAASQFFSLESKLVGTLKLAFLSPKKLVDNYLSGFKNFYFSPGRLFLLATLVFGFNFLFEDKKFFIISFGSDASAAGQLVVFAYVFVILSLASFTVYYKQKKSLVEHFAINLYAISTWLIFFSLLSLVYKIFDFTIFGGDFELLLFIVFHCYWVARMLESSITRQLLKSLLTLLLFVIIAFGGIYIVSGGDWQID